VPSFLPLVLFTLYPLADSGYLSLTKWNLLSPVKLFVGLSNYAAMPRDSVLRQAFVNTILYTVTVVPIGVIVGFVLALLLNRPMRLRALWRGIFFLPTVVPIAALSVVWLWIYDPHFGLMNYALRQLHLPTSAWLQSPTSALWATATTGASNGSVNSMHDSYTPLGGLIPMWLIQLGEVIYGGVGSGLYGMLAFVIVAVFAVSYTHLTLPTICSV